MQVCSGESGVADTAARVRGGAGRESRRRFGRHAWDLERDSLGHGYLARKHHPVRVGEKPRRWQNVGRRRSCGLQTWGLGRPELQAPQGQGGGPAEDGSDRAGCGRAREEGRMAWGQKCHWEEKAGGRGTGPGGGSGESSAGHCVASGGPGPRGAEYPAASSRRKRLSLSPWQSTLERTAAQQGRDKALAALRPAARQRPPAARREHSSPFILGEICPSSSPANFPSGGRTGCVPGHTHPHL